MASLDNAEHALVYPSGSAAIYALLHLLRPGDHFISCLEQYGKNYDFVLIPVVNVDGYQYSQVYFEILNLIQKLSFSGGTRMLFSDYAESQAMTVDFIDTTDIKQVEAGIKSNTKASSNFKCSKLHHFSKNNN